MVSRAEPVLITGHVFRTGRSNATGRSDRPDRDAPVLCAFAGCLRPAGEHARTRTEAPR